MYLPEHFKQTDIEALHGLIQHHPFALWVTSIEGQFCANPIPFWLDPQRGKWGTLCGHVSRANPIWRHCLQPLPSLVIFQGANAYVTPSYYLSKAQHGKVVPTWNYAAVHAHGNASAVEDADWLLQQVNAITAQQENNMAQPWSVSDLPSDYLDKVLQAIVGIEIPIEQLTGKWKFSQNRNLEDKLGVVVGLRETGHPDAIAVAEIMERHANQQN